MAPRLGAVTIRPHKAPLCDGAILVVREIAPNEADASPRLVLRLGCSYHRYIQRGIRYGLGQASRVYMGPTHTGYYVPLIAIIACLGFGTFFSSQRLKSRNPFPARSSPVSPNEISCYSFLFVASASFLKCKFYGWW